MQRIRALISGCNGRMGQVVSRMCAEAPDMEVVAGFDILTERRSGYPVYSDPMEFGGEADVIIDFSNPDSLASLLAYAQRKRTPVIICTTGHSRQQLEAIEEASKTVPLFKSGNMSVGINLLCGLVKKAAAALGEGFDIEIVERHHRMKIDAPSGTAIMLAEAAASALNRESELIFERQSVRRKRGKNEIGISCVRGGTIVGEHEVIFAGTDELVELKHSAASREVFANGAVTAARFMSKVTQPRIYDMTDALKEILDK